ncbi:MAG: xylosidase [Citrobacter freundii]|nr:MAG: xylosidase [Citrobacter freundii]
MKPFILSLCFLYSCCCAAQHYQKTVSGIKTIIGDIQIELQDYGPNIIRVTKWPAGKSFAPKSLSVIKAAEKSGFDVTENAGELRLSNRTLKIALNLSSGSISFTSSKGGLLLQEKPDGALFKPFNDASNPTNSVTQSFLLDSSEAIYGLGILQNGKMSQRNQNVKMVQGNTWDFVTFFQSVKGYGLFWDNYSPTIFNDDPQATSFTSEVGDGIDYYFIYGGNADGVVAGMRDITGQVPMFPLWTYGYWQSRERYKSQQEIVDVVRKYRDLKVPLDGIIQDWQYWGNNYQWNAMEFVSPEFNNAKKMIEDIHGMNARLAVSIWSSFGPMTKPYRELDAKGMLFNIKTWPESGRDLWPPDLSYPSGVRVYDAYNPDARDIYWKYLNKGIFSLGTDAWWMDSSEPDHFSQKPEDFDTKTYLGSFRKVRNAYPLMSVGGVYDHQRATTSDKRVFILTRSAFAGQQRYGASTWSGDVNSSWESLRNQIPAGLNFTLTGNPNFNSDLGGFFAGSYNKDWNGSGAKNPMFQELYVRWLQYGTFTPMMRSHGTDVPREIYQFGKKGEPVYDAIEAFIKLRYTLLPYVYATSWDVSKNQSSFMRALVMDFPTDKKVWNLGNEYMFGRSVLVTPVINPQYTPEKAVNTNEQSGWDKQNGNGDGKTGKIDFTQQKPVKVYLPAGASWYDFWTDSLQRGGQEITKEVRLNTIPVYIKAGSIIPFGPEVEYSTEKKWDSLTVKVYPGADASFVLYEDEFDNYNYEKGDYSEILFRWNNKAETLTIEARKGSFANMIPNRTFTIVLPDGRKKQVFYSGKKLSVRMK